jgi:Right handed beta helix region
LIQEKVMRRVLCVLLAIGASMLCGANAWATTTCHFTTIGTTMSLVADCKTDASILIPNGDTVDGRGHTITAVDPPADHFRGGILQSAPGAAIVNIRNVTLTTSGLQDPAVCDAGDDKLRAIALLGAGGSVRNVNIINILQGTHQCAEGSGIIANSPPFDGTHPATKTLTISNVRVRAFQYVGIQAVGDIKARIEDSEVVGAFEPDIPPAGQYALVAEQGAMVTIHDNEVRQDPSSTNTGVTGILLDDLSGGTVEDNAVLGSYAGIFVQAYCRAPLLAGDRNQIRDNYISARNEGVVLVARSLAGTSVCNAHVDNNLVQDNVITASGGGPASDGVFVGVQAFSGGFSPTADDNTIEDNFIDGFLSGIFRSGDTGTIIRDNVIVP